jgi:hypothetical protein
MVNAKLSRRMAYAEQWCITNRTGKTWAEQDRTSEKQGLRGRLSMTDAQMSV